MPTYPIGQNATTARDGEVNVANVVKGHVNGSNVSDEAIIVPSGAVDLPTTADATNPASGSTRLVARAGGLYVRTSGGAEVGPLGATPVDSVNGETGVVVLDAADVGAVPNDAVGLLPGETNRGTWDVAVSYAAGDVVAQAGADLYVALRATVGDQPDVSPADWDPIVDYTVRGVALGAGTDVGELATAAGALATASGGYSVAVGVGASSSGGASLAFGGDASAPGDGAIAIGNSTSAAGLYAAAVGQSTSAGGEASVAVGADASASGALAIAAGALAAATGEASVAIGTEATATGDASVAIGPSASAPGDGDVDLSIITGHITSISPGQYAPDQAIVVPSGAVDLPTTADATNPAADHQRLVARADGLYVRDQTGTEVGPLGAGGGGGIPETLIDAAGDLIVGTAADTAGRLALGAAGTVLTSTGSAAGWQANRHGLTVPLPSAIGFHRRIGSNVSLARGSVLWIRIPEIAHDAKVTHVWIDTVTGIASCTATGAIVSTTTAGKPGTVLASTAVGAIDMSVSAAMNGAALSSPYTLTTGGNYWVAVLALGGASDPTVRGADGVESWLNVNVGTAPVTPATNNTYGSLRLTGQASIPNTPAAVVGTVTPVVYLSVEAP